MINNDIVNGFDDEKDESLKIKLQKVNEIEGCLVLYLTGYIDTYNSNYFQKRVQRAIEAGYIRPVRRAKLRFFHRNRVVYGLS